MINLRVTIVWLCVVLSAPLNLLLILLVGHTVRISNCIFLYLHSTLATDGQFLTDVYSLLGRVSDPGPFVRIRNAFFSWVLIRIGTKSGSGSGSLKMPKIVRTGNFFLLNSTFSTLTFFSKVPKNHIDLSRYIVKKNLI